MQYSIYKTTNRVTGKFYVGKQHKNDPNYLGSGKLLHKAIKKHGKHNFEKTILEDKLTAKQANVREVYWIGKTGALGNQGYNMAKGGTGGDLSKFVDHSKIDRSNNDTSGLRRYWDSLTPAQRKAKHKAQAQKRAKTFYISPVDEPENETKVYNLKEWCAKNGYHPPNFYNRINPNHRLYGKQHKGLRIRPEGTPKLEPYEDLRGVNYGNNCKGKTWRMKDGKRVWITV